MAAIAPMVVSPTDGERFDAGPFRVIACVTGDRSGGLFELWDLAMGPATIDYHVHHNMDETLRVIEGEVEFWVDGKSIPGPTGTTAYVPRGVHHGFTNRGPAPARLLVVFTPSGGQSGYFRGLSSLFAAPSLDEEALRALRSEYDQELVEWPGK